MKCIYLNIDILYNRTLPAQSAVTVFVMASVLSISFWNCEHAVQPSVPPVTKRQFQWSRDSVDFQGRNSDLSIISIWGTNANDLWGAAGISADARDQLWHYDGVCWKRATNDPLFTDGSGYHIVNAIYGTSANNVWAVGTKLLPIGSAGFIMHYDGLGWRETTPDTIKNLNTEFFRILLYSENDLWISGYEYIAHFDGVRWIPYKIADSLIVSQLVPWNNDLLLTAFNPRGTGDTRYLFRWEKDKGSTLIDKTAPAKIGFENIFLVAGNTVWSCGYRFSSSTVSSKGTIDSTGWMVKFSLEYSITSYYPVRNDNIYFTGQGGQLINFNGIGFQNINITKIQNPRFEWYWGLWSDGDHIIFCDIENNVIYRRI